MPKKCNSNLKSYLTKSERKRDYKRDFISCSRALSEDKRLLAYFYANIFTERVLLTSLSVLVFPTMLTYEQL